MPETMPKPSPEEYRSWLSSEVGRWYLAQVRARYNEVHDEVDDGKLRGDRDAGISSDYRAGEVTGSLAVLNWILLGRIAEELSEEEKP